MKMFTATALALTLATGTAFAAAHSNAMVEAMDQDVSNGVVSAEGDTRRERSPEPQYQHDDDRLAAEGA